MALWYAVSRGVVLRKREAPNKTSATELLRPKDGEKVISAASWMLDQATPTREARPRESPRSRRLQRRAEASARYRARERAPDALTVTERNKQPWSEARRRAASDGQKKRYAAMSREERVAHCQMMRDVRWPKRDGRIERGVQARKDGRTNAARRAESNAAYLAKYHATKHEKRIE